jgi:hypothetical protein
LYLPVFFSVEHLPFFYFAFALPIVFLYIIISSFRSNIIIGTSAGLLWTFIGLVLITKIGGYYLINFDFLAPVIGGMASPLIPYLMNKSIKIFEK